MTRRVAPSLTTVLLARPMQPVRWSRLGGALLTLIGLVLVASADPTVTPEPGVAEAGAAKPDVARPELAEPAGTDQDLFVPPASRDEDLQFTGASRVVIRGQLRLPAEPKDRPVPVVVLLHPMLLDRDAMGALADQLLRQRVGVVQLDVRGHGQSRNTDGGAKVYAFPLVPWTDLHLVVEDVRQLLTLLATKPGVDSRRFGICGAGEGALIASEAAARNPDLHALAMIDPTDEAAGFAPARDLSLLGPRPALLVASAFAPSRERIRLLAEYGQGERQVLEVAEYQKTSRLLLPGAAATLGTARWFATTLRAR